MYNPNDVFQKQLSQLAESFKQTAPPVPGFQPVQPASEQVKSVPGIAGVREYLKNMAASSSQILMDETQNMFFLVRKKEYVMDSVNNQATQAGLRDILLSSANNNYETAQLLNQQNMMYLNQNQANQINVLQGFNALQQQIAQVGFQMENCCCSIKTQMLQDKYEELVEKYRTAQNDLSNAAQSQYILGALGRFVAYPPAAAAAST